MIDKRQLESWKDQAYSIQVSAASLDLLLSRTDLPAEARKKITGALFASEKLYQELNQAYAVMHGRGKYKNEGMENIFDKQY